jgi:pimeloyl-ACP methyl ester carboxylesterase
METSFPLTDATFSSSRHTTHYWEAGPAGGPLMIFVHGWPQIGLVWRAQIEAWRCIAPDMRGYGGSLRRSPRRPMP